LPSCPLRTLSAGPACRHQAPDALLTFSRRYDSDRDLHSFPTRRSSDLEIEAGKSYCSRRFGGATCDDKSAQIYARFDKNDWRIQPAEFYRFHDAEVNTFGYF